MTKQEMLDAFIQAEKDWSEPSKTSIEKHTNWGLCWYFIGKQNLKDEQMYNLKIYWIKYRTTYVSTMHFRGFGWQEQGRQERLEAIRKVIIDLKNELNELH